MRRRLLVVVAIVAAALAVAAGVFVVRHDWVVEDLMERVHEGNDSPWAIVRRQAATDAPDWDALREPLTGFTEMAEALRAAKSADIRESADGYLDAVAGLGEAVGSRTTEGFRRSVTALGTSCRDCHFDGGMGGTLGDD